MRFLRDVSIRHKVTRIIMVTSSIAIFLLWTAFVIYELTCFRASIEHELVIVGDLVGLNSVAAIEFHDSAAAEEILAGLRANPGIVAGCIYVQQHVFATYQGLDLMRPRIPAKPGRDGVHLEGGFVSIFWPITLDNRRIGTVYIQHDLQEFYADLKRYILIAGAILAVSLALSFLLSRIFQGVISGPVSHLADIAQKVSAKKDYSIRAVKQSQDEMGLLTERFNEMLDHIQSRDEALQEAHDELERRVEERTTELAQSNRDLQMEMVEREGVQTALRQSEQRYRALFEAAGEGIVVADIETKNFTYANPAICEMLDYTEEELKRMSVMDIHPKETLEHVISEFEAQARGEQKLAADIPCLRKDGSTIYADINTAMVWIDGRKCNVGFFTDITERMKAEEELRKHREHLEQLVEERTKELTDAQEQLVRQEKLTVMGKLAGGLGHELRNPLGAIKNAVYLLNMVLDEPEPEVKETLEIIEKEVGISEGVITSLLDFARPRPPTRQIVDMNDVVREALSRVPVPENVELVEELSDKLPTISADPVQLYQVFGNLAVNAIQAMTEGGRLLVKTSASPVEPSEAPGTERISVSFADTGVGMDEETVGKILEPLFTTKPKGIGLGLALTSMLVEAHEGTIEIESEVGHGTTFTVKLPVG